MSNEYKKDKKFSEGYRGSSSEQASRKKKEGHKWEKVFEKQEPTEEQLKESYAQITPDRGPNAII